ncbi:DNA-binding protein [Escherichia coli]|nr:DNA-binding protein [Escherichia coli]
MAKVLNTHEQADFERLAAFYPYRDEHGLIELVQE